VRLDTQNIKGAGPYSLLPPGATKTQRHNTPLEHDNTRENRQSPSGWGVNGAPQLINGLAYKNIPAIQRKRNQQKKGGDRNKKKLMGDYTLFG